MRSIKIIFTSFLELLRDQTVAYMVITYFSLAPSPSFVRIATEFETVESY